MISGAEIMVKCLEAEDIKVIFGYPGAAICPFYDCLLKSDIKHVLVRQEQNAAHAASGYARAICRPGVCVATSGPGATNLITGVATAYMDSIPLVVITGQVRSDLLGRDVFQEADITGACEPFVKHSYLVTSADELPRVFKEAFEIASTGRPGPVLIDIPVDIQTSTTDSFEYPQNADIIGYKPNTMGNTLQIKRALDLLNKAKRPVICSGGGVLSSGAKSRLVQFAEKTDIPVVSTMMGIGVMPSEHRLYLGMLGSHGCKAANKVISEADLIIICGARVGDRSVASPMQMAEQASVIHIDIDPAEIGKNIKASVPIVGDMKHVLDEIINRVDYHVDNSWTEQISHQKQLLDDCMERFDGYVEPKSFLNKLSAMLPPKSILTVDVGQNQIWCANSFNIKEGRFLTSGGMGTMGYSLPAAIGAKAARCDREVVVVCGDGAFQMSMSELATVVQEQYAVRIVIMQNDRLGMVRELQDKQYSGRHSAVTLNGNPDFVKLANAYGIDACEVTDNEQALKKAGEMLKSDKPYLLVCRVHPDTPSV